MLGLACKTYRDLFQCSGSPVGLVQFEQCDRGCESRTAVLKGLSRGVSQLDSGASRRPLWTRLHCVRSSGPRQFRRQSGIKDGFNGRHSCHSEWQPSAVHMAARAENPAALNAPLQAHAVVNLIDCEGLTPLDYARRSRNHASERLLLAAGATVGIAEPA
ncbi:hypothetical protein GQ53DRAFT_83942 [Thozetella sp. PMI_491]|nr:hypothetical protein GQ53DRAFT_83942 [Thozetella sp. PMI_491]